MKIYFFIGRVLRVERKQFHGTQLEFQTTKGITTDLDILPENVLKRTKTGHSLVMVKRTRVKGFCVECIKRNNDPMYKKNMTKIITHCPRCPGGVWICSECFDRTHAHL